ncbi:histidinol-phosphate transaminase [Sulfuracidifex tepidarius]|uniref:(5-formylfuran-3-yl)methyl phosphate transaminase n=1 Tax=Sulfuracidifex tepidarius TaxID=1294262 RepID=A0A510DUV8_9CREN|nr:histidinol-phosphate transaminase [Sulfuracidifex tepidarius]BBG24012.1 (5-formylfuran-3-yl)methyl phosphate transaminase [Sulfuracidifex tepidarius]BBG26767.1 (5-formylfuran-3-yl)methyl phosphate transaminase [Sulfuracidifex tepidarius]
MHASNIFKQRERIGDGFVIAPTEIKDKIKPWLLQAKEYDFTDIKEGIRLHLNESPYRPPDVVLEEASKAMVNCNRYQHPELVQNFRELVSEYNHVDFNMVYPSPGADGSLRSIFYNFLSPGSKIVINNPSYSMYKVYSSVMGLKVTNIALRPEGEWWVEGEELTKESTDAEMVIIDNPNNPTGSPLLDKSKVKELAETTKGFVLIDEAYFEFYGSTVSDLVNEYPNLMIVRTLSKAFSMASFRVGYTIAHEDVVKALLKSSTPFDIALPSIVAGIKAMENRWYVNDVVKQVKENREVLLKGLRNLGLRVYNSVTNFLLVDTDKDLWTPLWNHGIAIRRLGKYYRISVGTREEVNLLLKVLGDFLENSNTK